MGLFSSKKTTRVGTTVSRVIADAKIPSAITTGITKALFSDGQMVENILEELVSSVGVRATNMYKYGRDHYAFGLPTGTMLASSDGAGVVASQLKSLYGTGTTVSYHQFGPLNNLHFGWKRLCEQHGYTSATNQLGGLTSAKGVPVYLKDMVVVVSNATLSELANGSLDQWGVPPNSGYLPGRELATAALKLHTPFKVAVASSDHLVVTYVWQTDTTVMVEGVNINRKVMNEASFTIPVEGMDEQADYFQVKYSIGGKEGYWFYKMGSGTYPLIDAVFTPKPDKQGSYFPIGYFRYAKQSVLATPASVEYRQSEKLMKFLGMDFSTVAEAIEKNPDIAAVESALLMLAVPASTSNPGEQKYLFDFFDRIYIEAGSSAVSAATPLFRASPKISLVIEDTRFKTALSCAAVVKVRKVGVLGKVGTHASGRDTKLVTTRGTDADLVSSVPYHYYRQQISDVLYDELQVVDLQMTYFVYGNYTTVGDELDAILLIPLDYAITSNYTIPEKEELYSRSMHYIFNSKVITEVKWYQTGVFQVIMVIVAIAIAWVDGGYTLAGVISAISAATAYQIFMYIALKALVYVALREGFKLFVKVVGVEIAFVAAIVAALVGVGMAIDAGSIAGCPWAKDLLVLSAGLSQGVQTGLQDAMAGLIDESEVFAKLVDTKTTLLEEANKLLENAGKLSPFMLFGEKPDDFYNRTVHAGNIGILGLNMVGSYVDTALTLPKLSETI